jgi:ABC-type multidrug transport system fused ATPase/permease subunit
MRGRTTFIIAHRLSTVRKADRIVVLEDGRIVETGSHEQLLARNGMFRRFHQFQSG